MESATTFTAEWPTSRAMTGVKICPSAVVDHMHLNGANDACVMCHVS